MKLHLDINTFEDLSQIVSQWRQIPIEAVKRDYLIVLMLQNLSKSHLADSCIFKGGTSLSKCYPGTIQRFSEDIDLTFLDTVLSNKQKDRMLKEIEKVIWADLPHKKIADERSRISKSSFVWLKEIGKENRIKLEIGSTIRPEPSQKMTLKTYFQEFLEENGYVDLISTFELESVNLSVLDITRTFLDKVLAVKRHAFNNDLKRKVRHIYDVVQLFHTTEIQLFMESHHDLKNLLTLTKHTDHYYINKRKNHTNNYNPLNPYSFEDWRHLFEDKEIRSAYQNLHKDLLYTEKPQNFEEAILVFEHINKALEKVEND